MLSWVARIDLLKQDLIAKPHAFVMARELPFSIFRCDPASADDSEWAVRQKVQLLATRVENETRRRIVILPLAGADSRPTGDLLRKAEAKLAADARALLLTHATVFAPSAERISSLFEQLHPSVRAPTVLFYTRTWSHMPNSKGWCPDEQALESYRVKIHGRES